jgi:regulatory protein
MAGAWTVDPLDVALRALRAREHSAASIDERLARHGFGENERDSTIRRLEQLGYLDDERFARLRAEALCARGSGNRLIDADLTRNGIDRAVRERVLDSLPPEHDRAAAIVARRGASPKVARLLAARGFDEEAVGRVVAQSGGDD